MSRSHTQLFVSIRALCAGVCAACAATGPADGQIAAEAITLQTAEGVARGWVAEVDLTHPAVSVEALVVPTGSEGVVELITPDAWFSDDESLRLVVNANYFGTRGDGTAKIVGMCVAARESISRERVFDGVPDPAIVITQDGFASAAPSGAGMHAMRTDGDKARAARSAFAGVGGSTSSDVKGTLLVASGLNTGETARVQPMVRHPRTALGVSEDGRTLIVAVIDGRQDGWSVGLTLPELAGVMLRRGAWDAVNLDGGGSSAFLWRDGDAIRGNRPSDGGYRPVAVSLGVRVEEGVSASQADGE
ncbi:MAG: phosphodiester glycosidase family protein [Planctomycetota bacterium]